MQAPPPARSYTYTHLLPTHHRDDADRPHPHSSTPRTIPPTQPDAAAPSTHHKKADPDPDPDPDPEPERTISDHALYLLLMLERPMSPEAPHPPPPPSPGAGSSSSSSSSSGEEDGAAAQKADPAPKNTPRASTAMKPSLKRPGEREREWEAGGGKKKKKKKRKKVSWAKAVSVRHYPEDSYADGRRFESGRGRGAGEEREGGEKEKEKERGKEKEKETEKDGRRGGGG